MACGLRCKLVYMCVYRTARDGGVRGHAPYICHGCCVNELPSLPFFMGGSVVVV